MFTENAVLVRRLDILPLPQFNVARFATAFAVAQSKPRLTIFNLRGPARVFPTTHYEPFFKSGSILDLLCAFALFFLYDRCMIENSLLTSFFDLQSLGLIFALALLRLPLFLQVLRDSFSLLLLDRRLQQRIHTNPFLESRICCFRRASSIKLLHSTHSSSVVVIATSAKSIPIQPVSSVESSFAKTNQPIPSRPSCSPLRKRIKLLSIVRGHQFREKDSSSFTSSIVLTFAKRNQPVSSVVLTFAGRDPISFLFTL
ncbi:hypothetical protein BDZ45DRAFT_435357 [Acephala macrosclerotiorum]|nr:hypothetical protein BDZ45DRAFT_435357 [Acephala macrosclerotiorum]